MPHNTTINWITVYKMLERAFIEYRYTLGYSIDDSILTARIAVDGWISKCYFAWTTPAMLAGYWIAVLGFVYEVHDWLAAHDGFISFLRGRIIFHTESGFYWGQLVARPTASMFDFWICGQAPLGLTGVEVKFEQPTIPNIYLHTCDCGQSLEVGMISKYTYTWKTCRTAFRGYAFIADTNIYRFRAPTEYEEFWDVPIGWQITENPCWWMSAPASNYFQYEGSGNKPPL